MHIPNAFPDKQRMIEQLSDKKRSDRTKELLQDLTLKNQSKMQLKVIKEDDKKVKKVPDAREFEDEEKVVDPKERKIRKAPIKEYQKVIDMADVVIEVLDARDPINFRCAEAEKMILESKTDKKLIFVLSKIDLVPLPVVMAWKRELEKEHPVVLLKGTTHKQTVPIGHTKQFQNSYDKSSDQLHEMLRSIKSLGSDKLFDLIKSYSQGKKTSIGVIGYPSSGKTAVINSLKRKRAAGVSSSSGNKKAMQEFEIDAKLKVIDAPGTIAPTEAEAIHAFRNQVDPAEVKDPITPITAILEIINRNQMMLIYKIAHYDNPQGFLYNVAVAKGKFKKVSFFNSREE